MIEQDILSTIQNVGFPIFVTMWFMFRTEKIIKKNTDVIESLSDRLNEYYKLK